MGAARNWLFRHERETPVEKPSVEQLLLADLKDNGNHFLRALGALSYLLKISPAVLDSAQRCLAEVTRTVEMAAPHEGYAGSGVRPMVDYSKIEEPREAAALDLDMFGEGRTIEEVQGSALAGGFPKGRPGQIRSSINAKGNKGVFFQVDDQERVYLTSKGRRLAQEVKERLGL